MSSRIKSRVANIFHTKYPIVDFVLKQEGYKIDENDPSGRSDFNLVWMDTGVTMDVVIGLKPWQIINHFPGRHQLSLTVGMNEICRKDTLARNLNKLAKNFPEIYDFFPRTWYLPNDYMSLVSYSNKYKASYFIGKPDACSQGRGIFLFNNPSISIDAQETDIIVQKYMNNPLLLDGYKFDLRIYVLVTSASPMKAYIYKEGLIRLATVPYSKASQNNEKINYMHLTNYAVNKCNPEFDVDKKRKLSDLFNSDSKFDKVWEEIKRLVGKTLLIVQPILERNYNSCSKSKFWLSEDSSERFSQCFELLGFDILLDEQLKPWLLEVNHSPSLTADTPVDCEVKRSLLSETLHLVSGHESFLSECKTRFRKILRKTSKNRLLNLDAEHTVDIPRVDPQLNNYELVLDTSNLTVLEKEIQNYCKSNFAHESKETNALKVRQKYLEEKKKHLENKIKAVEFWKQAQKEKSKSYKPNLYIKPKLKEVVKLPSIKTKEVYQLSTINISDSLSTLDEDFNGIIPYESPAFPKKFNKSKQ